MTDQAVTSYCLRIRSGHAKDNRECFERSDSVFQRLPAHASDRRAVVRSPCLERSACQSLSRIATGRKSSAENGPLLGDVQTTPADSMGQSAAFCIARVANDSTSAPNVCAHPDCAILGYKPGSLQEQGCRTTGGRGLKCRRAAASELLTECAMGRYADRGRSRPWDHPSRTRP